MKKCVGLIALLLLAGNVQAAEYYRSIDSKGKVHYGDKPLGDAADIEKLKVQPEPDPGNLLPFETRRAMEKFPVTLYVAESCGEACELARGYLNKRGIPFVEKSLATPEDINTFKKASGGDQIPALNVGKNWLKGYLESQWSQELDTAGYPKTAPYGVRPAVKPAAEPKSE